MKSLLLRYPILMGILFAIFTLFSVNAGITEVRSINALTEHGEKLSLAEIGQRINQGSNELNVELVDGEIKCSTLNYLETTYGLIIKEYTTHVLITSSNNSIVLYSFFNGTPSCEEIGSKPIFGIITKMEDAAIAGMYKTNLKGIRKYPNALILRFCGGCTKGSMNKYLYFGFGAFSFLGFLFSMYLQWKIWSEEEKANARQ